MAVCQTAMASTVVVPGLLAGTEGNSGSTAILAASAQTFQYLYAASDFSLNSGDTLTGMSFRLNGGNTTIPGALTWTRFDVQISTTTIFPGSLSTTFADNDGANAKIVRSGSMSMPSGSFTNGQTPNAFGGDIAFTDPFVYTGNNLILTIRTSGFASGTSTTVDSATNVSGHYQGQGSNIGSSATVANGATATAVVIQYDVTPVPEPATTVLLAGGLVLLILLRRRRA